MQRQRWRTCTVGPGCQPGMARREDAGPMEAGSAAVAATSVTIPAAGGGRAGSRRLRTRAADVGRPCKIRAPCDRIRGSGREIQHTPNKGKILITMPILL